MLFNYVFVYFLIAVTCASTAAVILMQIDINMGSETEIKAFRGLLVWYFIFALTNMIWVWINYGYLNIPGTLFSITNLISICVASYYWFEYVEAKLSESFVKTRWFKIISLIPLTLALILIITTPVTNLVFYYNENNEYIHGVLYSTMFILAIIYLLFATIHIIFNLKNVTSKTKRRELIIVALFLIFPVIAGLLDMMIENLPVMELSLLFGLILVYTFLQKSNIFYDNLTQLNNRRSADRFLENHMPNISNTHPLYYFMCDIDKFKSINDTYGHIEGDKALRIIGRALRNYHEKEHYFVSRWGGDEFCIMIYGIDLENPDLVINDIQKLIDKEVEINNLPYQLKLSYGYIKCTSPYNSIEKIVDAADKLLYKNKNIVV